MDAQAKKPPGPSAGAAGDGTSPGSGSRLDDSPNGDGTNPATNAAKHAAIYLAALGVALAAARRKRAPRFAWIVACEIVLIGALFLYWANRITGDLYNFNGFFVYAIQLLGLWVILGVIAAGVGVLLGIIWKKS